MKINSKWEKMKEIAAANKVPYRLYIQRISKGWSPEKAAGTETLVKRKPLAQRETKLKIKPMGRENALKKIDEEVNEHCKPCRYRNKLTNYRLLECEVGQRIQELGKHLTVGPRKSVTEANRR